MKKNLTSISAKAENNCSSVMTDLSQKTNATPEVYAHAKALLDKHLSCKEIDELNVLIDEYSFMTTIFVGDNGKKGMRHANGDILVPAIYDDFAFTFDCLMVNYEIIPALQDGKSGLVKCDGTGTPVTGFMYDSIGVVPMTTRAFFFKKDGSTAYGLMLSDGRELCPCVIDKHYEPSSVCMLLKGGNYYGLYDLHDRVVMPIYEDIEVGEPEEPMIFTYNGVLGYLDKDLKFVSKSDVDAIEDEDERQERLLDFLPGEYEI
mgnify:CR=1 FL=1